MPTPTKQIFKGRRGSGYESVPQQKYVTNIIIGRVVAINTGTKRVTIFSDASSGNIANVRYPNGMTPAIGNMCLVASPNPRDKTAYFVIAFYS